MDDCEFCVNWILDNACGKAVRVLDYGCGEGNIVDRLRAVGVEAFGCDIFYEGGDYSSRIPLLLFDTAVIKRIEANRIPFESDSFDFIVNTQVMEHVPDLDGVLNEILRVLRPGGKVLSLFPSRDVWREGHCGIAFLHWFPKHSRVRIYYAAFWRLLGFGYFKGTKSVMQWSRDFCQWLDQWTYYRTREAIESAWNRHFRHTEHLEDVWLQRRLGVVRAFAPVPRWAQRLLVRKLCGLVLVAQK